MRKSPLTGITTGAFDSLRVRTPPLTGSLVEVTDLVAGAIFDPSQLQGDIANNTAALTLKADQATTYTKGEVNAIADGKVDDSQVLTNVPVGAVFTDTVYTHPATHSIAEVSGLQAALNGKADDN